jgi:hypothetical protein
MGSSGRAARRDLLGVGEHVQILVDCSATSDDITNFVISSILHRPPQLRQMCRGYVWPNSALLTFSHDDS